MIKLFFTFFPFFGGYLFIIQGDNIKTFPVPPANADMLFYVQRSLNKNTLIYELNRFPGGKINTEKPVNIYWIRYEEDGGKEKLTSIQQFAYGMTHKNDSGILVLNFKRDKSRDIRLKKVGSTSYYKAHIYINGEESYLQRVYIQLKNNFFSLKPEITYIEIYGLNLKTNKPISERYIP